MDAARLTPRDDQELAIELALSQIGTSDGALIGDEPGFGKTLIGTELVLRAMREHGWARGLIIGLPDTHAQWEERIAAQSDGAVQVRIMNGTTPGRENFAAFMRHEPGIFVAGSHFLTEKDWESVRQVDPKRGGYLFKRVKTDNLAKGIKAGDLVLKERAKNAIGPAQEPTILTKSERLGVYRKFHRKPLDFVMFDEVQSIANKKSNTRQTILSIKAGYRLGMSGTWFLNKLENMWSVARWVWPGENPATGQPYVETNHEQWKKRYLIEQPVYGSKGKVLETARGTAITTVKGERIEGEFVGTLPAYIRRENDPVPDPTLVYCKPTAAQAAQIEDLQKDLMTWVDGWEGEEMPLVADMPAVLRTRLRQVAIAELSLGEDGSVQMSPSAASAKLAPLRGIIDFFGQQRIAIYTDSKIGAHFIAGRMQAAGYDARAWTGDLTRPQREELKQAFIRGEFPYLISTIQSFGTGLDGFQRVCNKVVWISEAQGDVALNDQGIRRYFRPGMTTEHGGFQHVKILMEGSVDVETLESLIEKAWRVRGAMNGGMAA